MELLQPKLTVQATSEGTLLVTLDGHESAAERLFFSVLIASTPIDKPARTLAEVALAACGRARELLGMIEAEFGLSLDDPSVKKQ
jgi:hypothetical protein